VILILPKKEKINLILNKTSALYHDIV